MKTAKRLSNSILILGIIHIVFGLTKRIIVIREQLYDIPIGFSDMGNTIYAICGRGQSLIEASIFIIMCRVIYILLRAAEVYIKTQNVDL